MDKSTLIIADDHELIRQSFEDFLSANDRYEVIAKGRNGLEVLELLDRHSPDLLILDINMPEMNGLECMEIVSKKWPEQKVLILTIYEEDYVVRRLLDLGIKGIVLKSATLKMLEEAVDRIISGLTFFDQVMLPPVMKKPENVVLTPREIEIIKNIAEGLSSMEIGNKLHISEYTVSTHRKNILKKLELTNIAQLVAFARNSGIM